MKINKPNNKKLIIGTVLILAVALLSAGLIYAVNTGFFSRETPVGDGDSINYNPPTQEEIDASQDGKKNLDKNGDKNDQEVEPGEKRPVGVGIAFADFDNGNLEIRAFTNSIIEGTGTCTATVTKGSEVISEKAEAFVDASSSQCRPILIDEDRLSSGTWEIKVTFSSPDAERTSQTITVEKQ